jgi:hypothetical protein
MRIKKQFNPLHASPSYRSFGESKPINNKKWYNPPIPIKYVTCDICHSVKGTFIRQEKNGKRIYVHKECLGVN